jgi:hypothetical protein
MSVNFSKISFFTLTGTEFFCLITIVLPTVPFFLFFFSRMLPKSMLSQSLASYVGSNGLMTLGIFSFLSSFFSSSIGYDSGYFSVWDSVFSFLA